MKHGRKRYEKGCRCETCCAANARHNVQQRTCRRCANPMRQAAPGRLCGLCVEELEQDDAA